MTFDIMLVQLETDCNTTYAPLEGVPRRTAQKERSSECYEHLFKPFVPLHKKKERQTCWSFLLVLLTLVAVVELRKGLCCLLQPRHEHLNVIQGAVEDLLRGEKASVFSVNQMREQSSRGHPNPHHVHLDPLDQLVR